MERDGGGGNHPSEEPRSYPPVALSFPLTRVKKIIKADKQVGVIQADAVLTMAAVAEAFLEYLTAQASTISEKEKRKTITYKDVANTVADDPRFHFLLELIPKPMPLLEALEYQRKRKAEHGEVMGEMGGLGEEDGGLESEESGGEPSSSDVVTPDRLKDCSMQGASDVEEERQDENYNYEE